MRIGNANLFPQYLGRIVVLNFPWKLNNECMFQMEVTKILLPESGYSIEQFNSDFKIDKCDGTIKFEAVSNV